MSPSPATNSFLRVRAQPTDHVRSIMSYPVATVDIGSSLSDVAAELLRNDIGAVMVNDGVRTGLVSERDLVALFATLDDATPAQIADAPTWDLVWATPEDTIADVAELMVEANVRHMPIGDGRAAVGIVSVRDIMEILLLNVREETSRTEPG